MSALGITHTAISNNTTLYFNSRFTIRDVSNYNFKVLKPSTNKKLGKIITKGKHKGKKNVYLNINRTRNLHE